MHPIYDLLLQLRSAGLGHEAVIEIMLALLGVMIAVLTLISGLLAIGIAVVGWFGYATIKDEAGRRAEQAALVTAQETAKIAAQEIARAVATKIAKEYVRRVFTQEQASALTTAQTVFQEPKKGVGKVKPDRSKATTDSGLRKDDI